MKQLFLSQLSSKTVAAILLVFAMGAGSNAHGQTIVNCGSTFTDSGGPDGNYGNSENIIYQMCPANPGEAAQVTFSSFITESADKLYVYNGPGITAPLIGTYSGNLTTNLPGGVSGIKSTDLSGCLSFRFNSNSSTNFAGWSAAVACEPQCMPPTGFFVNNPGVHALQLNWTAPANGLAPAGYEYEVRVSGAAGSGATGLVSSGLVPGTATSTLVSGLTGNTSFTIYLRTNCGGSDASLWTNGVSAITLPGCGSTFTDPGGPAANYANNLDTTTVLCPENPGDAVVVSFSKFRTQAVQDKLQVYNGNSISDPLIGTYSGLGLLNAPGAGEVIATNPTGCLTFRFQTNATSVDSGWLADVSCLPAPLTCIRPTGLSVSNVTVATAVLNWQAPAYTSPQYYEYEVRTSGAPGSGPAGLVVADTINAPGLTALITGLSANTTYYAYLRSSCGSGDYSLWTVVPLNFHTQPSCGSLFTDSGGPDGNYGNNQNLTYQLCPDDPGEAVRVTFSSFITESADKLYVYNGPGITAPLIGTYSGNLTTNLPGGVSGIKSTDLSGCLTFKFTSNSSTNFAGWGALINCEPQCMPPTGLFVNNPGPHSLQLNWTAPANGSTPVTYQYEVRSSGAAGSGPAGLVSSGTVPGTSDNAVAAGLAGNTAYTVYVRTGCGGSDASLWTAGVAAITLPSCGSTFTDPGGIAANYGNNLDTVTVICPDNPADVVAVSFSMFRTQAAQDKLLVYNGNSAAAPLVGIFSGTGLANAPGAGEITANNPSGCLTFRFQTNATTVDSGWLANVTCLAGPLTCIRPSGISATNITHNSAYLFWQAPLYSTPLNYQYEVRISGAPGSGAAGLVASGSVPATTVTTLVTGLSGNTLYSVYLRSECGSGDYSLWTNIPFKFRTQPGCGSTFTDSGGPDGNYSNNEDYTYVICPDNPGDTVRVAFGSFITQLNSDKLVAYNGPGITYPLIGTYSGNLTTNLPGGLAGFKSTDPSGCLTFRFTSNSSTTYAGWDAAVSCDAICTASVAVAANPGNTVCSGTPVTFTAMPVNGGIFPTYQWRINGVNAGTGGSTFTPASLANNDTVSVVLTSSAGCALTPTVSSNPVIMTISNTITPAAAVTVSPGTFICTGTTPTFTLNTNVAGGTVQWLLNGAHVGADNPVYTPAALATGDQVGAVVTIPAGAACYTAPGATAAPVTMTVASTITPAATVTLPTGTAVCSGVSNTFTLNTNVSGGVIQWMKNGMNVGTGGLTYTTASLATGDQVSAQVTAPSGGCYVFTEVISAPIIVTVTNTVTPSVTLNGPAGGIVCAGAVTTFSTASTNGGTAPAYQWFVNGNPVGGGATYATGSLMNGDVVTVQLASSATCAIPATVTTAPLPVSVVTPVMPFTLAVSGAAGVCANEAVSLAASSTVAGVTYQWQQNGASIAGANTASYNATALSAGAHTFRVIATMPAGCFTKPKDTSNDVAVTVSPVVSLAAPLLTGVSVPLGGSLYKAVYTLEVPAGVAAYEADWYVNGLLHHTSTNVNTWEHNPFTQDTVYVILHPAGGCYEPQIIGSNSIIVASATAVAGMPPPQGFRLYPNPARNSVRVEGMHAGDRLVLTDALGKVVLLHTFTSDQAAQVPLQALADGLYFGRFLTVSGRQWVVKLQKQQ